jgi:hypothetical protein
MATAPSLPTDEDILREQVRKNANELADLQIEPLLKKNVAGGVFNLEQARPYLETIVRIAGAVGAARFFLVASEISFNL